MGQSFLVCLLAEPVVKNEGWIRVWLAPYSYKYGNKLTEHSSKESEFVLAVMHLLSKFGQCGRSRVVWAGQYAAPEPVVGKTLFQLTDLKPKQCIMPPIDQKVGSYLLNWSKLEYVDVRKAGSVHPLPILTAEGNGMSGSDYSGKNEEYAGIWARDLISVEEWEPTDTWFDMSYKYVFGY